MLSTRSNTLNPMPRRNYTINEVCMIIPASRAHMNLLIKDGRLPKLKMGKSVLIPVKGVDDYLDSLVVAPTAATPTNH
jgi:excisionase family DNA binding protein